MQRISPVDSSTATPAVQERLAAVRAKMGSVPNIVATLAQSPAALGAYLGLSETLAAGRLSGALQEQIALATAGANGCDYCAAAHTVLGSMQGLGADEIRANLAGHASDPRSAAALRFVDRIIATRGRVSDEEFDAVQAAGFSTEEVVEMVANTVLNIFTNYFNHVADTEIDFPVVQIPSRAA